MCTLVSVVTRDINVYKKINHIDNIPIVKIFLWGLIFKALFKPLQRLS